MNNASYFSLPAFALAALIFHGAHPGGCSPRTNAASAGQEAGSSGNIGARPYGSHLKPLLAAVNASTEQKKEITEIVVQFKPAIEPVREKYREKREQFLKAIISGASAEDIMGKQAEMNELYDRISNEYCVMNLKVKRCLSSQQCELLQRFRVEQGWVKH